MYVFKISTKLPYFLNEDIPRYSVFQSEIWESIFLKRELDHNLNKLMSVSDRLYPYYIITLIYKFSLIMRTALCCAIKQLLDGSEERSSHLFRVGSMKSLLSLRFCKIFRLMLYWIFPAKWSLKRTMFTYNFKLKVCKSVHHTFQINQPTTCNNFSSLLLDVYVQLNMFQASLRPSSGAQQLQ